VAICCERGTESSGSINSGNCFDQLNDYHNKHISKYTPINKYDKINKHVNKHL
jgi:hypothetical protein